MKYISKYEIKECLSLLHPTYHHLCPIHLRGRIYHWLMSGAYCHKEDGILCGYYDPKENDIDLFPRAIACLCSMEEGYEELDIKKQIIFVLFHEIRHAYQFHSPKWKKHVHDDVLLEKDANKFAYRMMWKHLEEIEYILM